MENFSFMRHGEKLAAGQERVPLEDSGLTPEQQQKWLEAQEVVGAGIDPEITYENVPVIERMAEDIFNKLPEKSLLLFTSTDFPRTKMTSALLSMEVGRLALQNPDKHVATGSIWEPTEVAEQEDSISNLAGEAPGFLDMWKEFKNSKDAQEDPSLQDYFAQSGGGKTHPKEQEMIFKLANKDLASPNSVFKKRAEQIRGQIESFKERYPDEDYKTYFFGVGHVSTLIPVDVALNNREKYDSVEEIPTPLTIIKTEK